MTGSRMWRNAMSTPRERPSFCPSWCVRHHGELLGEDDTVHVSRSIWIRDVLVRLCATIGPDGGRPDGPYLMVGAEEFTLTEAAQLGDVVSRLVEEGSAVTHRAAV